MMPSCYSSYNIIPAVQLLTNQRLYSIDSWPTTYRPKRVAHTHTHIYNLLMFPMAIWDLCGCVLTDQLWMCNVHYIPNPCTLLDPRLYRRIPRHVWPEAVGWTLLHPASPPTYTQTATELWSPCCRSSQSDGRGFVQASNICCLWLWEQADDGLILCTTRLVYMYCYRWIGISPVTLLFKVIPSGRSWPLVFLATSMTWAKDFPLFLSVWASSPQRTSSDAAIAAELKITPCHKTVSRQATFAPPAKGTQRLP